MDRERRPFRVDEIDGRFLTLLFEGVGFRHDFDHVSRTIELGAELVHSGILSASRAGCSFYLGRSR